MLQDCMYKVIVQNNRLHYEFDIRRNITIIQGNSATGKTTLINMLRQAENLGADSGVDVNCDVPCRVLEGRNWKVILESISKSIIFIDEENVFINTEEFASAIQNSDNYYVLITRENLYDLPYSVEEIYGLHSSGKYQNTRKVYQQMYRIYSDKNILPIKPEKIPLSRVTGWDAWLNDNLRCWRILQSIFDVLIHRYLMGCCINEQLFMKVRGKADIEAAFECNFGLLSFCLAGFQIIIDGTVKIVQKFLGTFAFVRNQGTNPHDLTKKNAIFFGKLNASDIAFVLNSVIHMRPSCSKISINCLI